MRRLATALGLAAVAVAPAAHAEVRVERGAQVERIGFAGRDVAYERTRTGFPDYDWMVQRSAVVRQRPGGRPRFVASTGVTTDTGIDDAVSYSEWDISDSSLMLGLWTIVHYSAGPNDFATVEGGQIGGRPREIATCEDHNAGTPSVAVWRSIGAYEDVCGGRIFVRRLDRLRSSPLLSIDRSGEVDLTGRYLAVADGDGVDVLDRRDASRVYRLAHGGSTRAFAVQADGKIAASVRRAGECRIGWASPAEPKLHPLGLAACGSDVHIAGDRIAWLRPRGGRRQLVLARAGGRPRVIARFPGRTVLDHFAFDGRRLAYAVRRCDGRDTLLLRRSLSGPVWPDRDPVRCPGRVTDRSLVVRRPRKGVRVPMRCPRGCSGDYTLDGGYSYKPFSVARGRRRALIHLDYDTLDELHRTGRSEPTLSLDFENRAGRSGRERRIRLQLRHRG